MRGIGELAELTGHEEGGLLADVHGVVSDALEAPSDGDLAHAPLERLGVVDVAEHLVEHLSIRPVDEIVELVDPTRLRDVSRRECIE